MTDLGNVARGVLLGTFVGDAVAARWEGAPAVDLGEAEHRLRASLTASTLRYTDDTQLTLALAEHLCDHPHVSPQHLVATFLEHFEGERGYARGMFGVVEAWERGMAPDDAARSVFPEGSFGNGAAMRAAPVGVVWPDSPELATAARTQAAVTHAHPIGMDAAVAQARAVARAAAAGSFTVDDIAAIADACATDELGMSLRRAASMSRNHDTLPEIAEHIGTGVLADQSVPAALWVAAMADDVPDAVLLALALGGDADTIAAMACAVVGAATGVDTVPATWTAALEEGPRGLAYATDLADRLAAVAVSVRSAQTPAPGGPQPLG